jgi:hypothetical protein
MPIAFSKFRVKKLPSANPGYAYEKSGRNFTADDSAAAFKEGPARSDARV